RPSDYLERRCRLCFGSGARLSATGSHMPDCVVALDACFSQKHNKQRRDPPFSHPDSSMIAETVLDVTEEWVDNRREGNTVHTSQPRKRQKAQPSANASSDDPTLAAEILAKCENSFKAAQASIAKANTKQHDVTAAMALIC
ncbi:hypothetical protein HDZ31DRAFT_1093, partial [Schizophyllum fasciatum]